MQVGKYCVITDDVQFGKGVVVHGFANLYGCRIGDDTCIGAFVEIQNNVEIGKRVRIQSHTFICSDIVIEDDVFLGHNVTFINDRYPTVQDATAKTWTSESSLIRKGASIGSGSVILCGVEIGEGAVVGAGSVVTKNVPPHTIVASNPAEVIRTLSPGEHWQGGQASIEKKP